MNSKINVESTAKVVEEAAATYANIAKELSQTAKWMRENNDIDYVNDAIQIIITTPSRARIDLLYIRSMRALMKVILNNEKDLR